MLILTRNIGQVVIIGNNDIYITVLGVRGNQVRLGIKAEKNVSIHREEIYQKILSGESRKGKNTDPEVDGSESIQEENQDD